MEKLLCLFTLTCHKSDVNTICFLNDDISEDNFKMATGDMDGMICIWNVF